MQTELALLAGRLRQKIGLLAGLLFYCSLYVTPPILGLHIRIARATDSDTNIGDVSRLLLRTALVVCISIILRVDQGKQYEPS